MNGKSPDYTIYKVVAGWRGGAMLSRKGYDYDPIRAWETVLHIKPRKGSTLHDARELRRMRRGLG